MVLDPLVGRVKLVGKVCDLACQCILGLTRARSNIQVSQAYKDKEQSVILISRSLSFFLFWVAPTHTQKRQARHKDTRWVGVPHFRKPSKLLIHHSNIVNVGRHKDNTMQRLQGQEMGRGAAP